MSDEIGMPPPAYPAGWYPSHTAPGRQEYWDGARWTGAYAPEPAQPAPQTVEPGLAPVPAPVTARKMGVSTWIGIALVGLWLLISLVAGGMPAVLINGGAIVLVTALYVVITGRRSWMRVNGRRFGAALAGAALVVTFTGAGIVPREPSTDVVALVDSSESMAPQSAAPTSDPATQATTSASPAPKPTATATPSPKPAPTATPTPTTPKPTVVTKKVTETQVVDFTVTTVDDGTLAAGTQQVVTPGQAGKRTVVYSVTYSDGVETGRVLLTETVTVAPVTQVVANGTYVAPVPLVAAPPAGGGCDSNYDPCVPIASDVDCAGGSGNGPAYVSGPVYVIGSDVYELDRDGDGVACD